MKYTFVIWLFCSPAFADVTFVNGASSPVDVTGSVVFSIPVGGELTFQPSVSATNGIVVNGTSLSLEDGNLYAVNSDGSVSVSAVIASRRQDDSDNADYFLNGLEYGAVLGGVLAGWYSVKRGLTLGDLWRTD
jgi:hypothetical protein